MSKSDRIVKSADTLAPRYVRRPAPRRTGTRAAIIAAAVSEA